MNTRPSFAIGAQLYIFTKQENINWDETLGALKAAGYASVETFADQRQIPALCEKHNLKFAAVHLVPKALDDLDALIEYLKTIGVRDICSSGLLDWNQRSEDDYLATIEYLNAKGMALRAQDIQLHYHNHEWEFAAIDDNKIGIDLLLEDFDFAAIDLCFDAGWAWFAGVEADQFMRYHADKIGFMHLRDFNGKQSCALGVGFVDHAPIIEALQALPKLRGVMVEQDPDSDNPLRDMIISREYLLSEFQI